MADFVLSPLSLHLFHVGATFMTPASPTHSHGENAHAVRATFIAPAWEMIPFLTHKNVGETGAMNVARTPSHSQFFGQSAFMTPTSPTHSHPKAGVMHVTLTKSYTCTILYQSYTSMYKHCKINSIYISIDKHKEMCYNCRGRSPNSTVRVLYRGRVCTNLS